MTLEVTQLAESPEEMRLQQLVEKFSNSAIQGIINGVIQRQLAWDLELALIKKNEEKYKGAREAITKVPAIQGRDSRRLREEQVGLVVQGPQPSRQRGTKVERCSTPKRVTLVQLTPLDTIVRRRGGKGCYKSTENASKRRRSRSSDGRREASI